ncbi:amiloride-sensitive sodium channel subunit beta [Brachionus plicatilis]|uniref:Amiloride-sensitive sodium channel subunit beta n=1 Tax=Brachionus plicatilis TaxID=10195 RepID=A0A3M7RB72_BRAPC|nr:amiloride-sensitive sodium channel subunit beta [Brachionus plicatilis]
MESLGFGIDEMLIECSYSRVGCGSDDFEHTISPEFGNCYTFNSGRLRNGTRVSLKKSFFPGIKMGLSLTLSTGTSPTTMKTEGIILFIHNASTKPSSNIDFIDLTTGHSTNIAVKQEYTIKLPRPYSNCAGPSLKSSYNTALFKKTLSLFGKYQQKSCLNLCYYEYIKQRCDCYFPDMYGIKYSEACNLNDTTLDCINRFFNQYINSNEPLKCFDLCPEECETISYDYQISQAKFPTQFYFSNFLEPLYPDLETFEIGKQSTLAVNIFFNDIMITVIEDTKKKTFQQLLAEVGGFLGLCLGASFLTTVELAEILVKIIFLIKEKKTNDKSTSPKM